MKTTRVLMVCLGNICRSPLAEGILKSKVGDLHIEVESAGTGAYHIDKLPDSRSIAIAKKHGIDITHQRARQITNQDLKDFDLVFAMDKANYNNILQLAQDKGQKEKVFMIMNELYPNENISVPDPYYGGDNGFENVYKMLDKACNQLIERLK